jgi:hypothetical protein
MCSPVPGPHGLENGVCGCDGKFYRGPYEAKLAGVDSVDNLDCATCEGLTGAWNDAASSLPEGGGSCGDGGRCTLLCPPTGSPRIHFVQDGWDDWVTEAFLPINSAKAELGCEPNPACEGVSAVCDGSSCVLQYN